MPAGTGSPGALLEARHARANAVDVTFAEPPRAFDPADARDVLNPANWTIAVREPADAIVRLPQFVERIDAYTVRVYFDGELSPFAVYRITVSARATSAAGVPFLLCLDADFAAFGVATIRTSGIPADLQRTDLMNPQITRDAQQNDPPPLGTFQISDRGDYALERGRAYLRKRILRRAVTGLGGFFHLPAYGFAEGQKTLITPDLLRRTQARAQSQIMREPDVVSVSVSVKADPDAASVVVLRIRAIDREGNVVDEQVPIDLSAPIT